MCRPPLHRPEASSHDAVQQIAPCWEGLRVATHLEVLRHLSEGSRCGSPLGTFPSVELTPVAVHLSIASMGDKSPKATSKAAAQKQAKAAAASQKKKDVASAKRVPKK